MKRFVAIFVSVVFFASTLPCVAAEPIPFNALSESSSAMPTFAAMHASGDDQPSTAAHSGKRHLSKAGKILTWIGVGMLASGAAEMGYGFSHKNACSSGGYTFCVDDTNDAYKYGGAADAATGAVLLLVGLTRHTTN